MKTFSVPCLVRFLNSSGHGNKFILLQSCSETLNKRQLHGTSVVIHVMNKHRWVCKADSLRHDFANILTLMATNKNKKNKTVFPSWKTKYDGFQAVKILHRKTTVITQQLSVNYIITQFMYQDSKACWGSFQEDQLTSVAYVKSQVRTNIHQVLLLSPVHISEVEGWELGKGFEPCLGFLKYKIGQSRRVLETEVVNGPLVA